MAADAGAWWVNRQRNAMNATAENQKRLEKLAKKQAKKQAKAK
jgi:hypothetical protein